MNLGAANPQIAKRLVWWGLYLGWGGMVAFLFFGGAGRAGGGLKGPDELLGGASRLDAESSWMGIYLGGTKVGYVQTELAPRPEGGYAISEVSRMSGAMMGAVQQMRLQMSVVTDSTLALVSFEGRLDAAPYSTLFKGRHRDQVLEIELTAGGKSSQRYLPAPEPIYLSAAIKPLLGAGRLGAGDSLKLTGFDPLAVEMQDLIVIGAARQTHILFGRSVQARKLTTRMGGFESSLYVDEEGNSLAEFGPLGIVLRREEMEKALATDDGGGSVDFLDLFAVKPTGTITNARRVVRARYRVSGVDVPQLVGASARQSHLIGDTIEVNALAPRRGDIGEPDSAFVKDAPYIESRDPGIRSAAAAAVKGGMSRQDSLRLLSRWVFESVQKIPSAGLPSALAVLRNRSGDCNEHSVLFTAMARSLGIPVKIELGVVYQSGRFFYHAWPAAWVDGHWEEFEPTFGDERADAARIALAAGDLSSADQLAGAIGKIQIEILFAEEQ